MADCFLFCFLKPTSPKCWHVGQKGVSLLASLESGLKAANYKISTVESGGLMIFKRAFKARKVPGAIFARYVGLYFTTVL